MSDIEFAVVIPVGAGREENLTAVMECLARQVLRPTLTVLVCDGEDAWFDRTPNYSVKTTIIHAPKHQPGMNQPRNVGVRLVEEWGRQEPDRYGAITHVAFLDTDVQVDDDWLAQYAEEMAAGGRHGLYYAPYEFLPQGVTGRPKERHGDCELRWDMFDSHKRGTRYRGDLSKGLGAWSGNLVWNLEDFARVGGFWNDLYHGRCEDGELGLRAVHMDVPIGLVPKARGWHQWHPIKHRMVVERNSIDVPKINARHPWIELGAGGMEAFMVDEDGRRFDARCECGWTGNTALIWKHQAECQHGA